jgi:hypothetical protein
MSDTHTHYVLNQFTLSRVTLTTIIGVIIKWDVSAKLYYTGLEFEQSFILLGNTSLIIALILSLINLGSFTHKIKHDDVKDGCDRLGKESFNLMLILIGVGIFLKYICLVG